MCLSFNKCDTLIKRVLDLKFFHSHNSTFGKVRFVVTDKILHKISYEVVYYNLNVGYYTLIHSFGHKSLTKNFFHSNETYVFRKVFNRHSKAYYYNGNFVYFLIYDDNGHFFVLNYKGHLVHF